MTRKPMHLLLFAAAFTCRASFAADAQPATSPATLPGTSYKGWVHVSSPGQPTLDLNTEKLIYVVRGPTMTGEIPPNLPPHMEQRLRSMSASANVQFVQLKDLEVTEYRDGVLTTRLLDPREFQPIDEDIANLPVTADAFFADLRGVLGATAVHVSASTDRGLDRYDIEVPPAATEPASNPFSARSRPRSEVDGAIPTAIFTDPKTHRLRELLINGTTVTVTYGAPEFATIYDAGVPRDAKIVDLHPTPEALTVWKRIEARIDQPFPDGVMVMFVRHLQNGKVTSANVSVCGRTGTTWETRYYQLANTGQEGRLQVPDDWTGAGTEEFFRRTAAVLPEVHGGDGQRAWSYEIDPKTGEHFNAHPEMWVSKEGQITRSGIKRTSGPMEFTGAMAKDEERESTFMSEFYPRDAADRLGGGRARLELATSQDRPGLVALRAAEVQNVHGLADPIREITEQWIDPAHDDRPVFSVTTTYRNNADHEVLSIQIREFGDYATFPQPDGRSYPTTITWRDFYHMASPNGALVEEPSRQTATIHFFRGRKLPDLATPATRPEMP